MNQKRIKYILPGFLINSRNEIVIKIYSKYKEITRPNTTIYSFYGSFPAVCWDGGRICLGEKLPLRKLKKIKKFYQENNIALSFTFTNHFIEKKHLKDKYANKILKVFQNGINEVLLVSPILEKYIKEKYPKYKINKSIIATENIGYDTSDYNLSVLAVRYNNDFEYLKKIPFNERKKIEILCNEPCYDKCIYKYEHYKEISEIQLNLKNTNKKDENYGKCRYRKNIDMGSFFVTNSKQYFYISPKDIRNNYLPLGIEYYKVNGREKYECFGFENIVYYCIKDDYQNDVICCLYEYFINEIELEIRKQLKKYGVFFDEANTLWHERVDVYK